MKNQKYLIVIVCVVVSVLLLWIDLQNINIGFLQLHSIDEYTFYGSLKLMYSSLVTLKLSHLFGYGFYQYGFIYFFLNLIVALPGFISKHTELVILAPRLIASIFAVGSIVVVYKFAKLYISTWSSVILTIFLITMPAFLFNATWFHPDWPMTFFLLASVLYLAKDKWEFKKNFYIAVLFFSLAVAFKYQAITTLPILIVYIFYDLLSRATFTQFLTKIKIFAKALLMIAGVFLISNPFIVHPTGWKLFSGALVANLHSNATNHGVAAAVTVWDKITVAIGGYYINPLFLILLTLLSVWLIYLFWKNKERSIFSIVAINFVINLAYLLFFVNKAWQIYYVPVLIVGVLSLVYLLAKINLKRQVVILSLIVVIQLVVHVNHYAVLTSSRDEQAPDFNDYTSEQNIQLNESIIKNLQGKVTPTDYVMITPYTPFEYEKVGMDYEHIWTIYGPLSADAFDKEAYIDGQKRYWGDMKTREELATTFKEITFIVLRKNIPFIDTRKIEAVADKKSYNDAVKVVQDLNNGKLGYAVIAEDESVIIYKKK